MQGWDKYASYFAPEIDHAERILAKLGIEDHSPTIEDRFECLRICPLEDVKVIIFGDLYRERERNCGMALSVPRGQNIPPLLQEIYAELSRNYSYFKAPEHGDLSDWANEGVLLLPTSFSSPDHRGRDHRGIWMGLISKIIECVQGENPHAVFVFWGDKTRYIEMCSSKMAKLIAANPIRRGRKKKDDTPDFQGCNHFLKIDEILEKRGKKRIDWYII